jgi:hypothetical protein
MSKQWVCHISGQGDKWKVLLEISSRSQWQVEAGDASDCWYYLPKSEYRLCEPPDVWEDVTEECEVRSGKVWHEGCRVLLPENWDRYRMRKAKLCDGWAFIVEKKVQP